MTRYPYYERWSGSLPGRCLELPPGPNNPRNSEGAFATLRDGRILYVYTHYTGSSREDHAPACLMSRESAYGGRTWTSYDTLVLENEGAQNIMSVSLMRLGDGDLGLFYLRKNSWHDCRPFLRRSWNEGQTWGPPVVCVPDRPGYYVLNNDRAVRLASGRIVLPLCRHCLEGDDASDPQGTILCYLSDDDGRTWRQSAQEWQIHDEAGRRITAQEPGVVELTDGRLMMFIRTNAGCQMMSWSSDGGDTWTPSVPSPLRSPLSPASIKRLPSGALLAVWNDHAAPRWEGSERRVPLTLSLSRDEGRTWTPGRPLEGNETRGHYCYTAIHVVNDAALLAYCALDNLAWSRIVRVPLDWLELTEPDEPGQPYFKD